MAALSEGVLIVESPDKGGALITANYALDLGLEVFAIPGNIDAYTAKGTNELIFNGANMALAPSNILEVMRWEDPRNNKVIQSKNTELDNMENTVYQLLLTDELHFDELVRMTGFSGGELTACLTMMEINGIIKQLPGRMYTLARNLL